MAGTITERLAKFVVDTKYEDLPKEVIERGKDCILDVLGVTLTGSKEPLASILADVVKLNGGEPQATILGKGVKTSLLNAALVNGSIAHALDYDDYHEHAKSHPSAVVFPAILPVGEWKRVNGKAFITAFVLGFDVNCRIGRFCSNHMISSGRHPTGHIGHFAAAAAAAKLLGLDARRMNHAFGIAATQAAGLKRSFGTMSKPFHAGKAAMDGVLTALMAERGFTGSENILDGDENFLEVFVKKGDYSGVVADLGQSYDIMNVCIKPFAACGATHAAITGVLEIARKYEIRPEQVREIELDVSPQLMEVAVIPEPRTGLEGKFSVQHCVAVSISEKSAGEDKFTDAKVKDPTLVSLRHKVRLVPQDGYPMSKAAAIVKLANGQEYRQEVPAPKGDPRNPLTAPEVDDKFRVTASVLLPKDRVEKIIQAVRDLDRLDDVSKLVDLCKVPVPV